MAFSDDLNSNYREPLKNVLEQVPNFNVAAPLSTVSKASYGWRGLNRIRMYSCNFILNCSIHPYFPPYGISQLIILISVIYLASEVNFESFLLVKALIVEIQWHVIDPLWENLIKEWGESSERV